MKTKFTVIEEVARVRQMLENRVNDINASVHATLVMQGNAAPFINQSKAFRIYGRENIENWVEWGLIERIKDREGTGQVRYDLSKLILIAGTPNRCEYFKSKEK